MLYVVTCLISFLFSVVTRSESFICYFQSCWYHSRYSPFPLSVFPAACLVRLPYYLTLRNWELRFRDRQFSPIRNDQAAVLPSRNQNSIFVFSAHTRGQQVNLYYSNKLLNY